MTALSVIVTFYDESAFLRAALASIRGQGIRDLELIVVNDNPERFSEADVRALAGPHETTVLMHPHNMGLSAARNTGLDVAQGDYIAFLDADDYYVPGGLAAHLDFARSSKADMVHAPTFFTTAGSSRPKVLPRDEHYFGTKRVAEDLKTVEEAQFITSSWSSLYKRAFLERDNLRFDIEQRKFEDRLFVLEAVTHAKTLAFFGTPTRVWRGRANSISSSVTTPDTHKLQIQLLEKCETLMRKAVEDGRLPKRFAKRELFNTVSRLIWDLDVIPAILTSNDPIYRDLAARITKLLGQERFGQQIFDDAILTKINRVGMKTRKGKITRTNFFEIHKHLRQGDFSAAHEIIKSATVPTRRKAAPNRAAKRLVLHIGLHKTGTTFLQHQFQAHRKALLKHKVLFPETALSHQSAPLRPGAIAGHQQLVAATREDDPVLWAKLGREVRNSRANTVVISAENMLFPTAPDRRDLITHLLDRLSGFDQIDVVAVVRRPDVYLEHFWREWVADGAPSGAQTLPAFMVDHAANLTNLPDLFEPFETILGRPVTLLDYDTLATQGLWQGFCAAMDLPADLPAVDAPRYETPDRATTEVLRLLNIILPAGPRRRKLAAAWLAMYPRPQDKLSFLSPPERRALIDTWRERSGSFAKSHGLPDDYPVLDEWSAFEGLNADMLDAVGQLLAQDTPQTQMPYVVQQTVPHPPTPRPKADMSVTFRLRPWAAKLVRTARNLKIS